MSIEQEIRNEIDNIKQLKIDVDDINNHLSVLEGLCRDRNKKVVDDAYQRGLDDAWETAKKIALGFNDGGFTTHYLKEVFGSVSFQYAFKNYSASEAIEKLKAYEGHRDKDLCSGCVWEDRFDGDCSMCSNNYRWLYRAKDTTC